MTLILLTQQLRFLGGAKQLNVTIQKMNSLSKL